jgi:hypothetical protein
VIERWIAATDVFARIIRKEHGGSASARNAGLDAARGTWVSFPDPDDVLDSAYLDAIRRFLADLGADERHVSAVATKVVQFTDTAADATDDHVLGYRYREGPRTVHLEREPRFFHTHAPSGFFRRELVERFELRLDPQLRAAFEDAAFEAEYMLAIDDPVLGIVPDAVYAYRRRTDSVIGTMWSKPDRYTTVLEQGYLRLLRRRPAPPLWLQYLVLYDLIWCFYEYDRPGSEARAIDGALARDFLVLADEVLAMIDERAIYAYPLHPLPLHLRTALAARKSGRLLRPEARVVDDEAAAGVVRISYFRLPGDRDDKQEVITVDGIVRTPVHSIDHPIEYYGEIFLVARELVIDALGTVMLEVDGEVLPLTVGHAGTGAWSPRHER